MCHRIVVDHDRVCGFRFGSVKTLAEGLWPGLTRSKGAEYVSCSSGGVSGWDLAGDGPEACSARRSVTPADSRTGPRRRPSRRKRGELGEPRPSGAEDAVGDVPDVDRAQHRCARRSAGCPGTPGVGAAVGDAPDDLSPESARSSSSASRSGTREEVPPEHAVAARPAGTRGRRRSRGSCCWPSSCGRRGADGAGHAAVPGASVRRRLGARIFIPTTLRGIRGRIRAWPPRMRIWSAAQGSRKVYVSA